MYVYMYTDIDCVGQHSAFSKTFNDCWLGIGLDLIIIFYHLYLFTLNNYIFAFMLLH